jgi:meso-butanediol dehydrogenase/(S,S)-butanediol dehydrogenase/diacetyl reductase
LSRRPLRFEGKRILVTGATRGIGKACARAFLAEGARVAINGRTADSVSRAMPDFLESAVAAPGDVSTAAGCEVTVAAALDAFGGLDVLVNNAGIFVRQSVVESDEAAWDAVMAANIKSVQFCTKYALPALRVATGNVVNIASESGLNGYPNTSAYCASKGAVVNLTRSMAMEFAPDVRVNALCPGAVETDMARAAFALDGDQDAGIRAQQDAYPTGAIGTVEQCAEAVLFLASSDAAFINGASLPMEGGATVGKW